MQSASVGNLSTWITFVILGSSHECHRRTPLPAVTTEPVKNLTKMNEWGETIYDSDASDVVAGLRPLSLCTSGILPRMACIYAAAPQFKWPPANIFSSRLVTSHGSFFFWWAIEMDTNSVAKEIDALEIEIERESKAEIAAVTKARKKHEKMMKKNKINTQDDRFEPTDDEHQNKRLSMKKKKKTENIDDLIADFDLGEIDVSVSLVPCSASHTSWLLCCLVYHEVSFLSTLLPFPPPSSPPLYARKYTVEYSLCYGTNIFLGLCCLRRCGERWFDDWLWYVWFGMASCMHWSKKGLLEIFFNIYLILTQHFAACIDMISVQACLKSCCGVIKDFAFKFLSSQIILDRAKYTY